MTATTEAEKTAIATIENRAPTGRDLILHTDNLNAIVRVSELMANSKQMVPKHLRGNAGGCMAVTMQAMRWNMDPFALAVKTYTVDADGPVAYEGQAIIAALNNSPLLATRLSFVWEGAWERIVGRFKEVVSQKKDQNGQPILDNKGQPKKYIVPAWDFDKDEEGLKVIVSATLVGEKEPRVLELLMKQARTRNSPLWTEDPKQQLAYLAGRRWGRLHAPDVIMGVYTPDELTEFGGEKFMGMADVVGAPPAPPPAPAEWPADLFNTRLPDWRKAIAERKATVDAIVAKARTKYPLSAEQEKAIRAPITAAPPANVEDAEVKGAVAVTYARVAGELNDAKDIDALGVAADLIRMVVDEGQRKELDAIFTRRSAELTTD